MATETVHQNFSVPLKDKPQPIPCIKSFPLGTNDKPPARPPPPTLIFTHGASGTLDTPGILNFRTGFAKFAPITCFQGNSNLVSRTKMFNAVIDADESKNIPALGGRSMGARAAVAAAENRMVDKLVLVSYPLHTEKGVVRDEVLMEMIPENKVLFVIGDQDEMCELERLGEVRGRMTAKSWLVRVEGADHGMNVKPKKGTAPVGELTGKVVYEWLKSLEDGSLDERFMEGRIWWDREEEVGKWSGWEKESSGKAGPKEKQTTAKKTAKMAMKSTKKAAAPKATQESEEQEDEEATKPVRKAAKSKKKPKANEIAESNPDKKAKKPAKNAIKSKEGPEAKEFAKSGADESAEMTTRPKTKAAHEEVAKDEGEEPKGATKSVKRTRRKVVVEDEPEKPARKRRRA